MRADLPSSRCFASASQISAASFSTGLFAFCIFRARSARLVTVSRSLRHSSIVTVSMSATGSDAVLHVNDVRIVEAPRDLHDGVGLPDVRQELIAEPLSLVRPAHEARDVDEVDRRRHDAVRVDDRVERREAWVGHGHDAHVRLDGAKRVVRGLGLGRRERVEERRFSDVGETDDPDGEGHGRIRCASYHARSVLAR